MKQPPKSPWEVLERLRKAGCPTFYSPEQTRLLEALGFNPEAHGFEKGPSLEEAAKDPETVILCSNYTEGEPMILADNKVTACGWGCGRMIQHRPNVPEGLVKVCAACAVDRAESRE